MRERTRLIVGLILVLVAGVGGYALGRSVPQPGAEREVGNYCEAYARFAEVDASQFVIGADGLYTTTSFQDSEWRYAVAQLHNYSFEQGYVREPEVVVLPFDQSRALNYLASGTYGDFMSESLLAIARDGLTRCGVKLSSVGPLALNWIDIDVRGLPEFDRPD